MWRYLRFQARHASVGKTLGERDDKCPMRAKPSQFGGLSAHKHEETFAQIGLSPVNLLVDARCVTSCSGPLVVSANLAALIRLVLGIWGSIGRRCVCVPWSIAGMTDPAFPVRPLRHCTPPELASCPRPHASRNIFTLHDLLYLSLRPPR